MPAIPVTLVMLVQLLIAFLSGVAVAFQPGVNARLSDAAGHRAYGGLASFTIGLVVMLLYVAAVRPETPPAARLSQGPWWMWLGGVLGAFFVLVAIALVPRMGSASYLAAAVAGQLLASLLIDHCGWMGLTTVPVTPGKVGGVALIVGGMLCVRFL